MTYFTNKCLKMGATGATDQVAAFMEKTIIKRGILRLSLLFQTTHLSISFWNKGCPAWKSSPLKSVYVSEPPIQARRTGQVRSYQSSMGFMVDISATGIHRPTVSFFMVGVILCCFNPNTGTMPPPKSPLIWSSDGDSPGENQLQRMAHLKASRPKSFGLDSSIVPMVSPSIVPATRASKICILDRSWQDDFSEQCSKPEMASRILLVVEYDFPGNNLW